jgi:molybdopterin/thiamine biosynthesis adenylyltransferase
MKFSVAMSTETNRKLTKHLLLRPYLEDLCFALWNPSEGSSRFTALIAEVVFPELGDRNQHGNVSYNPQYIERVLKLATERNAGIALLHNHITPGWQGMSDDDFRAEQSIAGSVLAVTGLPIVGLTLGTDGSWSSRVWKKTAPRVFSPNWCENVRVIGDALSVTFCDDLQPKPEFREEFIRTVSAWGPLVQADLMRLNIGVVGLGSVGSVVAESLARMGVQNITLMDFDEIKRLNLDRTLNATLEDVGKSKVSVAAGRLRKNATAKNFQVIETEYSVIESNGFREILNCDLIFSCVDRPWPRSILNGIAHAHLIPVIDGGIIVKVGARGNLQGADWRAHTIAPGRRCMECLEQYCPSDVALERDGYLDNLSYIQSLPKEHRLRRNENVFAFSLSVASMEILQALSLIVNPSGLGNVGAKHFHFVTGQEDISHEGCLKTCIYPSFSAKGDRAGINWEDQHPSAEQARLERRTRKNVKENKNYTLERLILLLPDPVAQKFLGIFKKCKSIFIK